MIRFQTECLYLLPLKAGFYIDSLTLTIMTTQLLHKTTEREATQEWLREFNFVPGSVIEKLVRYDEAVSYYDSDAFRLIASPLIECPGCYGHYEGAFSLSELQNADARGQGVRCEHCQYNRGGDWQMGRPRYAFPCGWGTLFAPRDSCDIDWFKEHADAIAKLGFYVFESEDWDILLGIDAGGFDFYEAYWIPLYRLRGLRWHHE